jgi:hypothetical protein
VSSTIGKDQPAGGPASVASRQQEERQANAVERDQRATRFRASLTKPDTAAHGAAATKARDTLTAQTARSGDSKAGGKPEGADGTAGAGRAARDRDDNDRVDGAGSGTMADRAIGLGLTGEQALVLEAAMGTGAADKKPGHAGGLDMGLDDMAVGGPGGLDRSGKLGQTAGEEAMAEVAAAVSAAAAPVHGQSWARPEGPQQARPSARELPQPLPGVDPVHQLYIGRGPAGAEARMMITVGPLAGTEIQLREGPGGVQASIITQNASARQTLTAAMSAVAERLKAKGQKLDVKFDGRPQQQGTDQSPSARFAQARPEK